MVSRHQATEVVGDHAVVRGGVLEGFDGEVETRFQGQRPIVGVHLINNGGVIAALDHDGDIFMVLGRGAHHGRATDINILYGIFQRAAFAGNGLGERVEVNDNHINWCDIMLLHDGVVLTATAKNAAVDFRVQGFDASIHHFRETGVIGHFGYRQTFIC